MADKPEITGYVTAGVTLLLWAGTETVRWLRARRELLHHIPKQTIRIVTLPSSMDDPNFSWQLNHQTGRRVMFIGAQFNVTNITKTPIILIAAKMKRPAVLGAVRVRVLNPAWPPNRDDPGYNESTDVNLPGQHSIPPQATYRAYVGFNVTPPFKLDGEAFSTSIALVDQYANEHWLHNVTFPYHGFTRTDLKQTIEILSLDPNSSWHYRRRWFKRRAIATGSAYVKSTWNSDGLVLISAKLKSPAVVGQAMIWDAQAKSYGFYRLPRDDAVQVKFEFSIDPSLVQKGRPIVSEVCMVDQFRNEHWAFAMFRYSDKPFLP
jgi:hypothetical protein